MAAAMKIVFGLLTFVTCGMILGALFQLAFIHRLEDSYGALPWANDKEASILRLGYVKPEIVSWSPRIIVLHNFLSMEECEYLKGLAFPRLRVSTVVDARTGKGIKSDVRTSSGMFLTQEERKYPMIEAIEKRISVYSQVPVENGELIQVLRYEKNQYYRPHHDYFSDSYNVKHGGQRIATVLMYLSDNVEGGETYFPMVVAMATPLPGSPSLPLLPPLHTALNLHRKRHPLSPRHQIGPHRPQLPALLLELLLHHNRLPLQVRRHRMLERAQGIRRRITSKSKSRPNPSPSLASASSSVSKSSNSKRSRESLKRTRSGRCSPWMSD